MIEVKIMIAILSSHLIFIVATLFILISIVQLLFYISFTADLKNYLFYLDRYRIRYLKHKKRNINFYIC